MVRNLPDEILHLICDQITGPESFSTLYQCAISSRRLAVPALKALYQASDLWAAIVNIRSEFPGQGHNVGRLVLLWHSIVASTFGRTYLPYYRFLRVFDAEVLEDFLITHRFCGDRNIFFTEGLDVMKSWREHFGGPEIIIYSRPFAIWDMVDRIGDAITSKDSLLEELKGDMYPESLVRWITRSPRLQQLRLRQIKPLSGETAVSIREHCPRFHQLCISQREPTPPMPSDRGIRKFMQELPSSTLEDFVVQYREYASFPIGQLKVQADSLIKIIVSKIRWDSVTSFPDIGACPRLEVLHLENSSYPSQKKAPDATDEMAQWISSCENLTELRLMNIRGVADISAKVILDEKIRLTSLTVGGGCSVTDSQALQRALRNQPCLEELELAGKPSDPLLNCPAILVESLCLLPNLKAIELKGVSDNFTSEDIISLTTHLPKLESIATTGFSFHDSIWESISDHQRLSFLYLQGPSWFTVDGLMAFASRVQDRGFFLEITRQHEEAGVTKEDRDRIHKTIRHTGRGFFSMGTLCDHEPTDYESEPYSDTSSMSGLSSDDVSDVSSDISSDDSSDMSSNGLGLPLFFLDPSETNSTSNSQPISDPGDEDASGEPDPV